VQVSLAKEKSHEVASEKPEQRSEEDPQAVEPKRG
jgi:hypothetical protein